MQHSHQQIMEETQNFFQRVYLWMFFGLVLSGATANYVANSDSLSAVILGTPLFFVLLIAELGLVFGLAGFINKLSANTAIFMYLLYSFMTGLTLSSIFLVYTIESIGQVFFITAGMFGVMSAYGYFTKADLTKMGQILIMALIGVIIASLVNLFFGNTMIDFALSVISVIIFTGLTAYDTQKIKEKNIIGNEGSDEDTKESILGALHLYLDFINLFLNMLRLMGKRRN